MTRTLAWKNISLSDLIRCPGYDGTEAKTKEIMWQLGVDTTREIETIVTPHRNMNNQVVTCEYYLGIERTDAQWIRSGHASIEALYASKPDAELQKDMARMNRQGLSGRTFTRNTGNNKQQTEE